MSRCCSPEKAQAYFDEQIARVNEPTVAGGSRTAEGGQLHLLSGAMDEYRLLTRSTVGGLPRRGILKNVI